MTKAIRTTSSGASTLKSILSLFVFMLTCVIQVNAQKTVPIRGTVISADDGEPLVGVSVQQEGSSVGAVTDIDGNFTL